MRPVALLPLLALALAGCVAPATLDATSLPNPGSDAPVALPALDYYDAAWEQGKGFHTLEEIEGRMRAIAAAAPHLARLETIGSSNEGRPLRALVLENRAVPGPKPAAFIDGGHHANEVEGIEVPLFLADFLVANHATNATVRAIVDGLETWIVPVVNPDGYVVQTRANARDVNLNRNYDLDWCDPVAYNSCGPVGEAIITATGEPFEYAGTEPFSEPESRAIRDATLALGDRLAFYLSHHTDVHCITSPWTAPDPPFPVPAEHRAVFDAVFAWVEANSEFGAGAWTWATGECMSYSAGGTSMDWAYATHRVPSFTFEVGGSEAREGAGVGRPLTFVEEQAHGDLRHWVEAALPVGLMFLANAAKLQAWDPELQDPPSPQG